MRFLAALLALPLLGCGPSNDPGIIVPDAESALEAGQLRDARSEFLRALDLMEEDTAHPMYVRAKIGAIQALAFDEPEVCVEQFFELAVTGAADEREFAQLADRLAKSKHFQSASSVLAGGRELFPDSPELAALGKKVAGQAKLAAATDPGAAAALDSLSGLGYVSNE